MNNRHRTVLAATIVAFMALVFACSDDGDGISNFYFASANNTGTVKLTLSVTTNLAISVAQPLAVAVYSNIKSDGTPGTVYRSYAVTATNDLVILATNIAVSPLYVVAWHDLNKNGVLDTLEPFATHNGAFTLTNLKPLKVYGATTNLLSLGVTHYYLYRTATLRVALTYTGTNEASVTSRLGVAVFGGTNFGVAPLKTDTWLQTKSRTFMIPGITAGTVYLAGWFDKNGDKSHAAGEPCVVYQSGNATASATAITLTTNMTSETSISQSFGDTYSDFN